MTAKTADGTVTGGTAARLRQCNARLAAKFIIQIALPLVQSEPRRYAWANPDMQGI